MVIGCGNFGARPQPPFAASNEASMAAVARSSSSVVGSSSPAASRALVGQALDEPAAGRLDLVAPLAPGALDAFEDLAERGHPVPRLVGKVGPAVERAAVGSQEHRHRPAAAPGHRLDRGHVDLIEIGTLLAVDLDRHEVVVEIARRRLVLERLAFHHVTPMAGGVADAQEDRPVQEPGPSEGFGPPRIPLDRVAGVLEEIGTRLPGEAIGHVRMVRGVGAWRHQKRSG